MGATQNRVPGLKSRADGAGDRSLPAMSGNIGQDSLGHIQGPAAMAPRHADRRSALNGRGEFPLFVEKGVGLSDGEVSQGKMIAEQAVLEVRSLCGLQRGNIKIIVEQPAGGAHQLGLTRAEINISDAAAADDVHQSPRLPVDPRGKQIGHTAAGKGQSGLRPILIGSEDSRAKGFDRNQLIVGQRKRHIDIVNHQIENDADIGGAAGKGSGAGRVNINRFTQVWGDRWDRGR